MANTDPVIVNRIDWLKLFPGLNLLRAGGMAFRLRILIPSYIAILCSIIGPNTFVRSPEILQDLCPDWLTTWMMFESPTFADVFGISGPAVGIPPTIAATSSTVWALMSGGAGRFEPNCLMLSWNLIILSVFGVAISRATSTEFCQRTRTGAFASLKFSIVRFPAMLVSVLLAGGIIMVFMIPVLFADWLASWSTVATNLVAIMWVFISGATIIAVIAALICGIGWLVSNGAIGTDQCGGADALSRGINYVSSHKLLTAWYFVVVSVVAVSARLVCSFLVENATSILTHRVQGVPASHWSSSDLVARVLNSSQKFIQFLPDAVHFGAFLSGTTLVYVVLRQREDAVKLTEIDAAVSTST